MLPQYLVILGGCLVCEELLIQGGGALTGLAAKQDSCSWLAALDMSYQDPLKPACSCLSLFLSVLRAEPPFSQRAEGYKHERDWVRA